MDKRRLVLTCAIITLLAICAITSVIFAMSRQAAPSRIEPTPITVKGNLGCLPHKDASPGQPQTLECAIGITSDDGSYYGLQNLSQDATTTPFTKHVTVSGNLVAPEPNTPYNTRGTITVTSFNAD